jgi:EmrB/QacA subfamily drug resistance transporter
MRFPLRQSRPGVVLAVICLSVFVINVSTLIVNIALPALVTELGATTRDLLWIVDAFNLTFAAFVLAAGSLSDRYGRREWLMGGLVLFGAASLAGAWAGSPDALIAWRAVAGIGAAVIFPVTLSIIVDVFPERRARAKAIGAWGAATGAAIAAGPIVGGFLVEAFWWGSILAFTGAVAAVALVLVVVTVPPSRDPSAPRLDRRGLILSTLALGALVHAIIEGPERGWGSSATLTGFTVAIVLMVAFVLVERRVRIPMLDVRLFANLRFTAASAAVTLSSFALFGFIFLITQYFQVIKAYGALETGLRILPVAISVGLTSVLGARLALVAGTKAVVAGGLLLMSTGYAWISFASADTSYLEIVGQMLLVGSGMGLTAAPATEAIMGVVPAAKAGVGSAVNDATREVGGTLGVAVIGSVALSLYSDAITGSDLPAAVVERAEGSVVAAVVAGQQVAASDPALGARIVELAQGGFLDGLAAGCLVASAVTLFGALLVARYLPAQPAPAPAAPDGVPAAPAVPAAA